MSLYTHALNDSPGVNLINDVINKQTNISSELNMNEGGSVHAHIGNAVGCETGVQQTYAVKNSCQGTGYSNRWTTKCDIECDRVLRSTCSKSHHNPSQGVWEQLGEEGGKDMARYQHSKSSHVQKYQPTFFGHRTSTELYIHLCVLIGVYVHVHTML